MVVREAAPKGGPQGEPPCLGPPSPRGDKDPHFSLEFGRFWWGSGTTGGGKARSCLIAPIGVGGLGNGMAPLPFVGTLLQMQLASQIKPPLFDEESDSWADFVWEWDEYWQSLTDGGGVVSEGISLRFLVSVWGKTSRTPSLT